MNKTLLPIIIISTLSLTGCASHPKVIVDTHGLDKGMYQKDLAECRQIANQVESNVVGGIVAGAVVGAIIGGISNAGNNNGHHNGHRNGHRNRHYNKHHNEYRLSTASTAKLGAVSGGLLAGSGATHKRNRVLKNCIADRGYRILN